MNRVLPFLLLAVLPWGRGVAQVEVSQSRETPPEDTFFVDAVSFAGTDAPRSRVDVFILVGYNTLTFVKRDEVYDASFDVTLSIYDSLNSLVGEKVWTQEVKGIPFDQSVSSTMYSLTQRVFSVNPGKYSLSVTIRDNESRLTRRKTKALMVSDYATPQFALSDILLLSRLSEKGGVRSMAPSVSPNMGNMSDTFPIYFEAYNRPGVDTVRFVADIVDEKGEVKLTLDTLAGLRPARNEVFMRIPHGALGLGDYRLFVRAYPKDSTSLAKGAYLAITDRPFIVRWQWFPKSVKDINLAIDQLRYIATDDEYSGLKDATTAEEKQAKFIEFWRKRDPNPNTPRNEKMEEYYRRAEYANKHFTHYIDGWRTDMGMVYMMFGPPGDVSRHPFEVDSKPYEIWRYYEINYEFVFVDESGFGDYRLLTPVWEAWQRVR